MCLPSGSNLTSEDQMRVIESIKKTIAEKILSVEENEMS